MIGRLNRLRRMLAEALAPYTEDFSGFWFDVSRRYEEVRSFYEEHEWFRSLYQGIVALAIIASVDHLIGHQVAFRLMYIVPVFVASYRGEWFSSAFTTGSTLLVLTAFDKHFHLLNRETAPLGVTVNVVTLVLTSTLIVTLQRRIRRIDKIANSDALTGAMTRTAFQAHVESMIARAKEDATSVTIGVIDLDGFKRINDVRGHAVGDEVLVRLVQAFEKTIGRFGAVGRIGGDEFVFVVHDRSEEFVGRLISYAREAFGESVFSVAPLCTFSVGTARLGKDGSSYGELVNRADSRMYGEKSALEHVRAAVRVS